MGGAVGGAEQPRDVTAAAAPAAAIGGFAPAPAPAACKRRKTAPSPVPPAPPPLEVETDVPAVPIDGLDEFDLEYFSDEKVQPVAAASPEVALGEEFPEEDVVDLEADMETLLDGQRGVEEEVPAADTIDVEDVGGAGRGRGDRRR